MAKRRHIVLIGNSGAAINAVKGIRGIDTESLITIISEEQHNAYSPALTTYFIADRISGGWMNLVDDDFYERHGVDRRCGQRAVSLNVVKKQVSLEDGSYVHYDTVLIASGARPSLLDCPLPATGVFTLRTLEDAKKIHAEMSSWKKVLFAGAGLVSIQIANAIRKHVKQMTFIVGSHQILSQNLDARSAALIEQRILSEGGEFLFNRNIMGVEKSGTGITVHLDNNQTATGDALIVGKGVRTNIPELTPSGLVHINRGIRVDERMQTSVADVFAAGDVCEAPGLISKEHEFIPNWRNACFQGFVAGQNMAGGDMAFDGSLAMNAASLFGVVFVSVGRVRDLGFEWETAHCLDESKGIYKKLVFEGDRLVGAIMVGDIGESGIIAEMIRRQTTIPEEKKNLLIHPSRATPLLSRAL